MLKVLKEFKVLRMLKVLKVLKVLNVLRVLKVLNESLSSIQGPLLPKIADFHPTEGIYTKKWGRTSPADK